MLSEKSQTAAMTRILIIDQRRELAQALDESLVGGPYFCKLVPSESAAMVAAAEQPFDVVITAPESSGASPLALLDKLERARPAHPLMFLASAAASGSATIAATGPPPTFRCISPQHQFIELRRVMAEALELRARATARAAASWGNVVEPAPKSGVLTTTRPTRAGSDLGLIGSSPVMLSLFDRIRRVAVAHAAVLVLGESGAGKELVARGIHASGPLRDRPWVAVNVAAIPDQLLESEVFGHVRGAFTGATQARVGLLASADGGTLFLDEIGDMPLGLQAKLLRVIESGELRPVGGDAVRKVAVRIIAATHRDLPALIAQHRFREDLHFRLNVLQVVVPPLRDRKADIADLAMHFLAEARKRTPLAAVRAFSADAKDILVHAQWPGNVRELASVIERLVVLCPAEIITASDLSFLSHETSANPSVSVEAASVTILPVLTLKQVTNQYVERVLKCTDGNKKRTADILGIDLSTLYRWQAEERRENT